MLLSPLKRLSRVFDRASGSLSSGHQDDQASERREAPRHEALLEGRLCARGGDLPCGIRNVSVMGMTIVARDAPLAVGQAIEVTCDRMGTLCGTVRWAGDGTFGVQFLMPISLDTVYSARHSLPAGMRPRAGRARVKLSAKAHIGSFKRNVEVGNISVGGLMMVARLPLRPAQTLRIEFGDMPPVGGHVRWCEGGRCGVMFTRLLPIAIAEQIARESRLGSAWLEEVRSAHALIDED